MSMNDLEKQAREYAHEAHDSIGQMRKYGGLKYWTHTDAVADLLKQYGESEEVQAGGDLHDVVEDVYPKNQKYSLEDIRNKFGDEVTKYVKETTNVFTSDSYPNMNRAKRKHAEHDRLGTISKGAKAIKLADIAHNVEGIVDHNPGFAKVFLAEKSQALVYLRDGNPGLYKLAVRRVADEIAKLKKQ